MKLNVFIQSGDRTSFAEIPIIDRDSAGEYYDHVTDALHNMQTWGKIDHYQVTMEDDRDEV